MATDKRDGGDDNAANAAPAAGKDDKPAGDKAAGGKVADKKPPHGKTGPGPAGGDAAPPAQAGQARAAEQPSSRRPGRGPATALAAAALLLAIVALGAAWLLHEQQRKAQRSLDDTRAALAALEDRTGGVPDALDRLAARVDRLGGDIDALGGKIESDVRAEIDAFDDRLAALHELLRKTAAPVHEPADIENLLRIANDSLILQRDVATALAALQAADDRLSDIADPAFAETRRQLAREIGALRAMPRPDITGAAFTLSGMQEDIDALGLDSLRSPAGRRSAPTLADADGEPGADGGWRALLSDLWSKLSALVVIRRSDELEGPLIGPEQRMFLNQNLRLKLESARLALLSHDTEGFDHHLGIARDWIARWYDDGHAQVTALLERIDELRALDIDPGVPDISASLQALRDALERRRAPILDNGGESGDS